MISFRAFIFIISLFGLLSFSLADEDAVVNEDGRVFHKYIDGQGMAWEYEHVAEHIEGSPKSDVIVYHGPWVPGTDANAGNLLASSTGLFVWLAVRLMV